MDNHCSYSPQIASIRRLLFPSENDDCEEILEPTREDDNVEVLEL